VFVRSPGEAGDGTKANAKPWGPEMSDQKDLSIGIAAAVLWVILSLPTSASAQAPSADPAAKKTLTEAANALGMVRGLNRALDIVNMFEFTASGTMMDRNGGATKVSRITAGYDYVIPVARVDIEKATPDGKISRDITVAAGSLAWDESTPGVYLRPASTPAAERLRPIWLLPHGVILTGAKAPDKIKLTDKGGMKELSVALEDGTEVKGLLDAKNLMTHVEMKMDAQLLSADYADYKDFQDYGVMFPSRIVQKVDGRVVADLTVTEALANPYLIFPPPKELVRK
jgi:hypothetical protein